MFYKLKINEEYLSNPNELKQGNGFYLVESFNNLKQVHYYNNGFWLILEDAHMMPPELIDMFDGVDSDKEETKQYADKYVSEDFALRAMAIAKANGQSIKITDILKNND